MPLREKQMRSSQKYQPLVDYFVSNEIVREARVLPIVVGSSVATHRNTLNSLTTLWLDGKRLDKYLAISADGSSVEMACMRMNYK
jgi:hypothetical protein